MVLKLYYDLLSQPSRALYIFMHQANIEFEPVPVKLASGQHLTQKFKEKCSRFQKVPFIHDDDFKLAESVAIVRYLSRQYPIADHWYPQDSKKQALVDEYLEWQHLNIRLGCAMYFQVKWLRPKVTGRDTKPELLETRYKEMRKALDNFQNLFLSDSKFLFGDSVSFADITAACEIEQPRIAGFDATEHYPKIKVWLENVRKECNPVYEEAHNLLNTISSIERDNKL